MSIVVVVVVVGCWVVGNALDRAFAREVGWRAVWLVGCAEGGFSVRGGRGGGSIHTHSLSFSLSICVCVW